MDAIESVNFFDIAKLDDSKKSLDFCRKYNLLPDSDLKTCINCKHESKVVTISNKEKPNFPYLLRCKNCGKKNSITVNTWFEGCKFTMKQNVGLIYCWLLGLTIEVTASEMKLNKSTVCDYFAFCREVCYVICTNSSEPVGGPGEIVEIDESHITTRKYNRGRVLRNEMKQIWVFGGIQRSTKKCFIVRVNNRSKDTLVSLIKHFILPGTKIISEGWKAYSSLQNIHSFVNHSVEFVNSEDKSIYTQNIGREWKSLKKSIKREGRPGENDEMYIFQRLYFNELKLRNCIYPSQQLPVFLRDIAKVYTAKTIYYLKLTVGVNLKTLRMNNVIGFKFK